MTTVLTRANRPLPKKTIIAGALGNFVEWYDAIVFAYAAAAIGQIFYGNASTSVQLVASFSTFAVTYAVRPFSGIVLGIIADKIGRKNVLMFTVLLMGAATTTIGLLPGYDAIGILAPILLILCRVGQGIAAGGELMGAVTFVMEHVPAERRASGISLIQLGTGMAYPVAFAFSFALMNIGGGEWFNGSGWRWLFLSSAPLALVALYIRSLLTETPVFAALKESGEHTQRPGQEVLRVHKTKILALTLLGFVFMGNSILFLAYLPTYLRGREIDQNAVSVVIAATFLLFALCIPVWGLVLDRVKRHHFRVGSTAAYTLALIPSYLLITSNSIPAIAVGMSVLAVLLASLYAMFPLVAAEAMPPAVRTTGGNVAYNIGTAVIMGPVVLVAMQMVHWFGPVGPAFYGALLGVISVSAALIWRRHLDPDASFALQEAQSTLPEAAVDPDSPRQESLSTV